MAAVHRSGRAALANAAAVGFVGGWLTALVMPRGPSPPGGVVGAAMIIGLVVGTVTGFVLRSRWGILVAPLFSVTTFELLRAGAVGPSVDPPDLSTELGIYVAVLGRGFHGLIQLVPMVGAAAGAGLARRMHGTPMAGSVAELAKVELGGHEQTVLIRGRSTDDPVLLYLSDGPGQSDLGYTRYYMTELENDFVFAVWDQRGSGTSYAALDSTESWTLD